MTDHSNTPAAFTKTELNQLWATFGGDHRFEPFQNSQAMRLSAAVIRRHLAGGA